MASREVGEVGISRRAGVAARDGDADAGEHVVHEHVVGVVLADGRADEHVAERSALGALGGGAVPSPCTHGPSAATRGRVHAPPLQHPPQRRTVGCQTAYPRLPAATATAAAAATATANPITTTTTTTPTPTPTTPTRSTPRDATTPEGTRTSRDGRPEGGEAAAFSSHLQNRSCCTPQISKILKSENAFYLKIFNCIASPLPKCLLVQTANSRINV